MKKIWGSAFIALTLFLVSFSPPYSIEEVVTAIKGGNAGQLAKYFDNRIDITLPGKSDNYSKNQAEMILKDFFTQNSVQSFQIKHKGDNSDGSQFCIGTLKTKNGDFRTKFFMKMRGDKQVIQEMEFQPTE